MRLRYPAKAKPSEMIGQIVGPDAMNQSWVIESVEPIGTNENLRGWWATCVPLRAAEAAFGVKISAERAEEYRTRLQSGKPPLPTKRQVAEMQRRLRNPATWAEDGGRV